MSQILPDGNLGHDRMTAVVAQYADVGASGFPPPVNDLTHLHASRFSGFAYGLDVYNYDLLMAAVPTQKPPLLSAVSRVGSEKEVPIP